MGDSFTAKLERLISASRKVTAAETEEELNNVLDEAVKDGTIEEPYEGDFDEFMSNPNNVLDFS